VTDNFTQSAAMQDYLEAILNISEIAGVVRVTDIAAELGIAKASVSQALSNLKKLGLVIQEPYGAVELTCTGKKQAFEIRHRHHVLKNFLEALGVDTEIANEDACLMEHVVSKETIDKLIKFFEKNEFTNTKEPQPSRTRDEGE